MPGADLRPACRRQAWRAPGALARAFAWLRKCM